MESHALRLRLIGAAFALVTIALVVSSALGATGDVIASLVSAEGLLVAAIIDAVLVERRRRNPDRNAIGDDVKRHLAILFAISAVALPVTGCGAGALQAHARAASISVLALQAADSIAERAEHAALDACDTGDHACEDEVLHVTETIDAVIASTSLAVSGYVEAVQLAVAGGESPDLLSALVLAVLRLIEKWNELVAAFVPLGIDLPQLPASVLGLGGSP